MTDGASTVHTANTMALDRVDQRPGLTVHAQVNWSRWVANCPNPYCYNAEQLEPGQLDFRCTLCNVHSAVVWPPNGADIAYLLAMRPDFTTRNWLPGESLHDLLEENLAHGIVPPIVEAGAGPLVLVGEQIVAGTLEAADRAALGR
jgi:hypothetical protein